ncbi:MAG: hypothetical protein ACETWK_07375 [Candidatus Aminicenantaceae bacterium]
MRKYLIIMFGLLLLVPSLVFSDAASFKVTYFIPRAQSDLWEIEFENMDFSKSSFQNTSMGFSYEYFLTREISFLIGIDTYSQRKVGLYKDYDGITFDEGDFAFLKDYGFEGDFSISHVFDVSITPIQLSMKLAPTGRRFRIIPYLGAGVGIYLWNVRLQGDSIDFDDIWEYEDEDGWVYEIYQIYLTDAREENKINFGFHAFVGFSYPIARRMSIDTEFKFIMAKGNLTEGFEGFEPFDLSGYQISLGLSYWF